VPVDLVLATVYDVFDFDPSVPTYAPERNAKSVEYRKQRAAELGVSTYALYNRKSYHKCKGRKGGDPSDGSGIPVSAVLTSGSETSVGMCE
jgi:hypothetical protein